ncbi:uncharacterized protein LOC135370477 [Ornithodoros turicata]|uniref:uncharacterized protein LOC135370477 n=1 Tax=Ornithodoros turicata TaxID=34597 RepID=UPI00313940B6
MVLFPLIVVGSALVVSVRCVDVLAPGLPKLPVLFPNAPPDVLKIINMMRKTAEDMMQGLPMSDVKKEMLDTAHRRNSSVGEIREIAFESNGSPGDGGDTHISLQIQVIPLRMGNGTRLNGTKDPRAESLRRVLKLLEGKERRRIVNVTKVDPPNTAKASAAVEPQAKSDAVVPPSEQAPDSGDGQVVTKKQESTEKIARVLAHGRGPRNASQVMHTLVTAEVTASCYGVLFRHGLLIFVMVALCAFACFIGSLLPSTWKRRNPPVPVVANQVPKDRWISSKILADPRMYGIFRQKPVMLPAQAAAGDSY